MHYSELNLGPSGIGYGDSRWVVGVVTLRRVVGGGVGLMYVMFRVNVMFRDNVVFCCKVVELSRSATKSR